MSDEPIVAVRGEAVLEVEPEIARLGVSVTARDADRAKAMHLLNERAAAIDEIVASFGDAIEDSATTGVRVSPQLKNGKPRERVVGYVAVVSMTLTVRDFARLGELLAQVASQDLTEVSGPWWSLRPGSTVDRDARAAAVQDALQRARDYAAALGSEVTALIELADVGLLSDGLESGGPMRVMAAGMATRFRGPEEPDEFTFDISPEKQVVRASVEARLRITPPALAPVVTS